MPNTKKPLNEEQMNYFNKIAERDSVNKMLEMFKPVIKDYTSWSPAEINTTTIRKSTETI